MQDDNKPNYDDTAQIVDSIQEPQIVTNYDTPTVIGPEFSVKTTDKRRVNGLNLIILSIIVGLVGYFLAMAAGLGGILIIPFVYLFTPALFIYGVFASIKERRTQRKSVNLLIVLLLVTLSLVISVGVYISVRDSKREKNCQKYNVRDTSFTAYEDTDYARCLNGAID